MSRRGVRSRSTEPGVGVNRGAGRDQSTCRDQIAMGPGVATLSEVAADRAVAISGSGPSPEKRDLPFFQAMTSHSKMSARVRDHEQQSQVRKFIMKLRPSLRAKLLEFDLDTLEEAL
ncbi:hypothetical protein Taro_032387 [Colocasia esculenta]|uniref:Uncharacterized protein n=1 Tax=Colocasia esculenta TaxID=4460 RepID=A0A843W9A6_COLES|nr:hypothetical protein [Colocasia esculenta]